MGGGGMGGGGGGGGGGGRGGGNWGMNSMRRGDLASSDEDLGKVFDWHLMGRLLDYIRPYKRRASMGVGAMFVLQLSNIAQPYLPGRALDAIRESDSHALFII